MLFRNYGTDLRFARMFVPALLKVSLRALWYVNGPAKLAMLRMSLRRWLVWLPAKLRSWREGLAPPVTLHVIDDVGCRAACANCVFTAFHDRRDRLSLEELSDLLDQALAMNVTNIYLVGADPFYRDDTSAFLDVLARHRYQYFLLFTEGQQVAPEHLDQLRAAGNVALVLNIDGLEQATEQRKGKGSFAAQRELLDGLRARRMVFGVSSMTSTANLDEVTSEAFVRTLDEAGAYFLAYIPYSPVDRRAEAHLMLSEDQRDGLFDRALALNRTAARRMMVFDLLGIEQKLTSCPAGVYSMTVYHDGTVTPCLAIPAGHEASNVRRRPLAEIWRDDPLYRAIRARHAALCERNRRDGARDRVHCMFFTDSDFLRQYFDEHQGEIKVLAPYATQLGEEPAEEPAEEATGS